MMNGTGLAHLSNQHLNMIARTVLGFSRSKAADSATVSKPEVLSFVGCIRTGST
jgi:hypothetical protein